MNTALETAERNDAGQFVNRPGPGRPSKKIKSLIDKYRSESAQDELQKLAADVANLEGQMVAIDAELEEAESAYLESIKPTLRHKAELDLVLSRARVAVHYLSDPLGFSGTYTSAQTLELRFYGLLEEFTAARKTLRRNPQPDCTRAEALASHEKWSAVRRHEAARDEYDRLERELSAVRREAESAGVGLPAPEGTRSIGESGSGLVRPRRGIEEL